MGFLDLLFHLAGLLAPAAGVALLVSLCGRFLLGRELPNRSWGRFFAIDFAAGSAALLAGLALFGRDGRVASYLALIVACATSQWLLSRSWKG